MGQYWLGKTKPEKAFKQVATEFKNKIILTKFSID